MTQRYLEVALPVPLRSAFTYAVPTSYNGEELVGRRVLVPFRNRAMIGVGLTVSTQAPDAKRIKEIAELLDRVPALPPKLIELGQWISRYYLAPIGEAFRAMLPPEIELRHHREYWLTTEGRAYLHDLETNEENTDVEAAELTYLRLFEKGKSDAPERAVRETRVARMPGGDAAAEKFVRRGHLAARESTSRRKTRTQKIVAWNAAERSCPRQRRRRKNPRSPHRDAWPAAAESAAGTDRSFARHHRAPGKIRPPAILGRAAHSRRRSLGHRFHSANKRPKLRTKTRASRNLALAGSRKIHSGAAPRRHRQR